MRYRQGEWWVRPGLSPIGDAFHDGAACIHNILSYRTDPLRMWIVVFGCFGGAQGGTVFLFDPEQEPQLQAYVQYISDADRRIAIAVFDGRLYMGEGSNLRAVTITRAPYGVPLDQISTTFDTSIFSFPGFRISSLQEFDGKLFIALDGGAGLSKIAVWDGLSVSDGVTVPFDITGINPVTRFGIWRNKLVAGFGTATAHIRVRDAGAVPGTWTTVASAGVAAQEAPSMVSFKDILYLANGGTDIFAYNGTTLVSVRNIAAAGGVGGGINSVAVFNNDLYYAWNDVGTVHAMLGRYDPNSGPGSIEWQDSWKDFTAQTNPGHDLSNLHLVRSLVSYRDILFAAFFQGGAFGFASNVPVALVSSVGIDTLGRWDSYLQGNGLVGGTTFPILDLIPY